MRTGSRAGSSGSYLSAGAAWRVLRAAGADKKQDLAKGRAHSDPHPVTSMEPPCHWSAPLWRRCIDCDGPTWESSRLRRRPPGRRQVAASPRRRPPEATADAAAPRRPPGAAAGPRAGRPVRCLRHCHSPSATPKPPPWRGDVIGYIHSPLWATWPRRCAPACYYISTGCSFFANENDYRRRRCCCWNGILLSVCARTLLWRQLVAPKLNVCQWIIHCNIASASCAGHLLHCRCQNILVYHENNQSSKNSINHDKLFIALMSKCRRIPIVLAHWNQVFFIDS